MADNPKKKAFDPVAFGAMVGSEVKAIVDPLKQRIATLEQRCVKLERDCEDLLEYIGQVEAETKRTTAFLPKSALARAERPDSAIPSLSGERQ